MSCAPEIAVRPGAGMVRGDSQTSASSGPAERSQTTDASNASATGPIAGAGGRERALPYSDTPISSLNLVAVPDRASGVEFTAAKIADEAKDPAKREPPNRDSSLNSSAARPRLSNAPSRKSRLRSRQLAQIAIDRNNQAGRCAHAPGGERGTDFWNRFCY